ncbi:MAG: glycosyltransferase family 2 protein [Deltaproteobacteria bacterium]
MNGISAVIITKNDEARLARCLDSLTWVDEIIAVDDLSTDRTVEILEKYKAKVIRRASEFDFDTQRNTGIDAASGPWILQMDSDEVITPELRGEILASVTVAGQYAGFEIERKNFFLGKCLACDQGQALTKLFLKARGRYYGHHIHEQFRLDGAVKRLKEPVEHYHFESVSQFVQKLNVYTEQEARVMLAVERRLNRKDLERQMRANAFQVFNNTYFKKKGYSDGMYGLIYAGLKAARHLILYAKYCELIKDE